MSFDLNSVLERWTPPATFTVRLDDGDAIVFKSCESYAGYKQLMAKAADFANNWKAYQGEDVSTLPPFDKWLHLPVDRSEAVAAFMISELSVEPHFEHKDAFALMKAPLLVDYLLEQIRVHHRDATTVRLISGIDSEKKDLPPTKTPQG